MSNPIPIGPFLGFMIFTILYSNLILDSGKDSIFKYRKKQQQDNRSSFRQKFDKEIEQRTKFTHREAIEMLCLNAGFDLKYSDYILICSCISICLFFLSTFLINNVFLGIVLAFIGFKFPKQILGMIKTKRVEKLEQQIGPFLNMVIKRYEYTKDFEKSMINTTKEFVGMEPLFTELTKTVSEMALGISTTKALDNLAKRTSNKYLGLFSDYYAIAISLGTDEVRKNLLNQAYIQYEENRKMKSFLKEQISEPIRDCYLMIAVVPLLFLFGCFVINGYTDFMFNTLIGQAVIAGTFVALLGAIVFVNKVVGAPLDGRKEKNENNAANRK